MTLRIRAWDSCANFDNSTRYFHESLPIIFTEGRGTRLFDSDGRSYIDLNNGWSSTNFGHGHPRLLETLLQQASRLDVTANLLSDRRIELSHRLCEISGIPESLAFLDCTGSSAVELARKLVSAYTGKSKVLTFRGGFHGRSLGALSISNSEFLEPFSIPIPNHYVSADYAYCMRCSFGERPESCHAPCLQDVEDALDRHRDVAAIFFEPALGTGGFIFPPDQYLRGLRRLADRYQILLVVDEIQMGLGRCGEMFLHQRSGITPDIIVLGKSLGGGLYPISAVVGRSDIMKSLPPGTHTGSFCGSPIGCALGNCVIDILAEPSFLPEVRRKGKFVRQKLAELCFHLPPGTLLWETEGLAIGIEICDTTNTDNPGLKEMVRMKLLELGVFALGRGIMSNRLCLVPSLLMSDDELELCFKHLESAVKSAVL